MEKIIQRAKVGNYLEKMLLPRLLELLQFSQYMDRMGSRDRREIHRMKFHVLKEQFIIIS